MHTRLFQPHSPTQYVVLKMLKNCFKGMGYAIRNWIKVSENRVDWRTCWTR